MFSQLHVIACPGAQSRLPRSTVSVAWDHSLGCPGAKSRLPSSTVSVAWEHSLGCLGAVSVVQEQDLGCPGAHVAREHSLGRLGAQFPLLWSTVLVAHVIASLSGIILNFSLVLSLLDLPVSSSVMGPFLRSINSCNCIFMRCEMFARLVTLF